MNRVQQLQARLNESYQAQRYEDALKVCYALVDLVGPIADILILLLGLAEKTGTQYKAAQFAAECVQSGPDESKVKVAEHLMQIRQYAAALKVYMKMPDDLVAGVDIFEQKRRGLYFASRYEEAMPYMESYKGKSATHHFEYAKSLCFLFDDRFFLAEKELMKVLQVPDLPHGVKVVLANFFHWIGLYDKAVELALETARNESQLFAKLNLYKRATVCARGLGWETEQIKISIEALQALSAAKSGILNTPQWPEFLSYCALFSFWSGHGDWEDILLSAPRASIFSGVCATDVSQVQLDILEHWRDKLSGRDVFIVLPGPSAEGLADYMPQTRDRDIMFATVNKLDQVASLLLPEQQIDILAMAAKSHLNTEEGNFLPEFLKDDRERLLIMHDGAYASLDYVPDGDGFQEPLILPRGLESGISSSKPLTFQGINGLSMLLMTLVVLQPARVFLFGADGKSSGDQDYFFSNKRDDAIHRFDNMEQARSEARNIRLMVDTNTFNMLMPFMLEAMARVHDVPNLRIFNVGPESAITAFDKYSYEQAFTLLKEQA